MKKTLIIVPILLILLGLVSCSINQNSPSYCDPRGKEWYNTVELPNIAHPFRVSYDGIYTIFIDEDGQVELKLADGEIAKGTFSKAKGSYNISIKFDNGETTTGLCIKDGTNRFLQVAYKGETYSFRNNRQLSKEEFDNYQKEFINFLNQVYDTGIFPTLEEVQSNDLYKKFTDMHQIDPHCGGPIVYHELVKTTILEIEPSQYTTDITIMLDGVSTVVEMVEDSSCVLITKDGEIKKLLLEDIKASECLIKINTNYYPKNRVVSIYYIEK